MSIINMINKSITRLLERVRVAERLFPQYTCTGTIQYIRDAMDPGKPALGRYGARPNHRAWRPVLRLLEEYGSAGTRSRTRIVRGLNHIINESYYDSFWEEHIIGGFSTDRLEKFLKYGGGDEYYSLDDWREVKREIKDYGPITGRVPFSVRNCLRAGIPRWMIRVLTRDAAHFDGGYTPKWVSNLQEDTKPLKEFWNIDVTPVANIIATDGNTIGGTVFLRGELVITRYLTWD